MSKRYVNVFGRKGGRGVRPWLLIPKLAAVAGYLGGVMAMAALGGMLREADPATAGGLVKAAGAVFWLVLAPGAAAASLFGLGLLGLHGRALLSMRWLQVKLGLLVAGLPVVELVLLERLGRVRRLAEPLLREPVERGAFDAASMRAEATGLMWASLGVGGLLAAVVWLGRHKPRLGQNPAEAHRKAQARSGRGSGEVEGRGG